MIAEEKMSIDCPVHGRVPGQKGRVHGRVHGQFEILQKFELNCNIINNLISKF